MINDDQRLKIKHLVYELCGGGVTRDELLEEVNYYLDGVDEDREDQE